jgi:hypothetical protein
MWRYYLSAASLIIRQLITEYIYVFRMILNEMVFFSHGAKDPSEPGPPHYRGFAITLRHITLDRTPLDEWSACRRNLYLTANTCKVQHIHASAVIQNRDTSKQAAADPRHRRRGHWDRYNQWLVALINWLVLVMERCAFLCGVGTDFFQYYFVCFKVLKA